jgi:hypothetical protein
MPVGHKILLIATAILALAVCLELFTPTSSSKPFAKKVRNQLGSRISDIFGGFTSTLLAIVVVLLFAFVPGYLLILFARASWNNPPPAVAFATLVVGSMAYWYKRKVLLLYGITEIGFGILSAYQVGLHSTLPTTLITKWTVIVGSIYVVSRGLNNVADGLNKWLATDPEGTKAWAAERNKTLMESQARIRRGPTPEIFFRKF